MTALREIKKYQKNYDFLIIRVSFARLIREIIIKLKKDIFYI